MAYDSKFNAMQANMGLLPGSPSGMAYPTPTAADTAYRLSQEATQRASQAQQSVNMAAAGGSPVAAAVAVSNQFQQQFQGIQSQQSINPYAAQRMAQSLPGAPQYQQGYMPSPLTMTPANTGVFRPPPQPAMAPIAPMYAPSPTVSPFQPRMPAPMFQSPYEQQVQAADIQSNRGFSYASQIPGVAGQAVGIGGAAMLGSKLGGAFGGWGRVAGALGGAAMAVGSGFSQGMGEMFQTPMRAPIETRQMGAALQNSTRNFVVSGPQLHGMGMGLSQSGANSLASGIKDLSADSGFQRQTGNMFNRQDLMQMVNKGGQAGLFDMAQSVPEIKGVLRQTATTIKQFMELTNDPDITNVIREMGRMRQFGMTQQDMVSAAQGMKTYSRMAGTTVQGLQQIGGLPGAMTFQQSGMTAATGFNYGNFAAASARQTVAGGGMSSRQLALMGGVQGMAQRDIQAQAAFNSMPLFGASNAQFNEGSWTTGGGGARGGAQGMVRNALSGMNSGVRQGGIGALAMYPTQQREIADRAAANMTPEQLQAQRFSMAMETGQSLGLQGMGAFALGAQTAFGQEVGTQMMYQARNPEMWRSQRQNIRERRKRLGVDQAAAAEEAAPGVIGGLYNDSDLKRGVDTYGRAFRGGTENIRGFFGGIGDSIGNEWDDFTAPEGVVRTRKPKSTAITSKAHRAALMGADVSKYQTTSAHEAAIASKNRLLGGGTFSSQWDTISSLGEALNYQDEGLSKTWADIGGGVGELGGLGFSSPGVASFAQGAFDIVTSQAAYGTEGTATEVERVLKSADRKAAKDKSLFRAANDASTGKGADKAAAILDKVTGGKGHAILTTAGQKLSKRLNSDGSSGFLESLFDSKAIAKRAKTKTLSGAFTLEYANPDIGGKSKKDLIESIIAEGGDPSKLDNLSPEELETVLGATVAGAKKDKEAAQTINSAEAKATTRLAESKETAMEITATNNAESRDQMQELLGLEIDTGLGFSVDVAGRGDFDELTITQRESERAMMASIGAGRDSKAGRAAYDSAEKAYIKEHGSRKGFQEQYRKQEKAFGELSSDVQKIYTNIGKRGKNGIRGLEQDVGERQAEQIGGALKSDEFQDTISDYTDPTKMADLNRTVGDISGRDIANTISREGLKKMAAEGPEGLRRAIMYRKAQLGGKGSQEAIHKIEKEALATTTEGEVSEKAAVDPTGKEAEKLEASEKAMTQMALMFSDFKPAAKDFKEGTQKLLEVVDTLSMRDSEE